MSPYDQTFAMMSPTLASPVMGGGMMMGNPNQGPQFGPTKQLYNLYTADQSQAYVMSLYEVSGQHLTLAEFRLFVRMDPKADKGFFRANDCQDWICYRRNYFSSMYFCLIVWHFADVVELTEFRCSFRSIFARE
jgi:hypothetical protein